jgi:hypothetical protein
MTGNNFHFKRPVSVMASGAILLTISGCLSVEDEYYDGIVTVGEARSACSQAAYDRGSMIGPTDVLGIETVDFEDNDFEVLGYVDIETGPGQSFETLFTCTIYDGRVRDVFIEGYD